MSLLVFNQACDPQGLQQGNFLFLFFVLFGFSQPVSSNSIGMVGEHRNEVEISTESTTIWHFLSTV